MSARQCCAFFLVLLPAMIKATCFESDKMYSPLDMVGQGRTEESTGADCQQRCASVSGCAHFSWWANGGCHLQDTGSSVQAASGVTAGARTCQATSATTCFESDKKYSPIDMSGQNRTVASSADTCQQRCATVLGCSHFSWWGRDGGCHLQDAGSSVQTASGVTAGAPTCQATCFESDKMYSPLDMGGQYKTIETTHTACQQRCASVFGCAHFSWWADGGCHLQDTGSIVKDNLWSTTSTAGPPTCQVPPLTLPFTAPTPDPSQCYEVFEVDEQWGTRYSTGYSQIVFPHYSGMVAAVHNSGYSMLEIGGLATKGVKEISERGNGGRLLDEIREAKPNTLDPLFVGLTIGATNRKLGLATLDSNHPYVSMIAMIAPSPDWSIYGQANLAPNGTFVDSLDVDMHLIDAGSCEGVDKFEFCRGRHGTPVPIFYRKSPITGPNIDDEEKRVFMKIRFEKASCDGRRLSATRSGLTVEVMV